MPFGFPVSLDGGAGGLGLSSSASSGPVSLNTGGVNFAPNRSEASRLVDPMTLMIVGGIVLAAVVLRRR